MGVGVDKPRRQAGALAVDFGGGCAHFADGGDPVTIDSHIAFKRGRTGAVQDFDVADCYIGH